MKNETIENVNVADLLPEALKESMSQLHLDTLQEAFDKLVESKVQSQINIAVKSAEMNFDEHVNERLVKLVEKMEESHKVGMMRALSAVNERVHLMRESYEKRIAKLTKRANRATVNESRKLDRHETNAKESVLKVVNAYEKRLNEAKVQAIKGMAGIKEYYEDKVMRDARKFKNGLVESVQAYLNKEIDDRVPYEDVREAMRNNTAMELVESLKRVLAVDAVTKMEVLKAPLNEACEIISKSKNDNNKLITENNKLRDIIADKDRELERQLNESNRKIAKAKQVIAEAKRVAYLNERLSTLPSIEQRNFVKDLLDGQSIEFIKENWDYTVNQYRSRQAKEKAILAEKAEAARRGRQIAEISRRRLTEASRNVREAQQLNENASPTDRLIEAIIEDSNLL